MMAETESLAGGLNRFVELLVFEAVLRDFGIHKLQNFIEQPERVDIEFVFRRKQSSQADHNLTQAVFEDFPLGLQVLIFLKSIDLVFSTGSPVEVGRVIRDGRVLLNTAPLIREEMCGKEVNRLARGLE